MNPPVISLNFAVEAWTARLFAEPTSSMALLVLVAFTPATCDVGCASGCGPNTLCSGGALGGAPATAGATIVQHHFDMALERSTGSGATVVWEGYPPPTYFLSSMCNEEGPCLAYEDFPGAFGLDSAPHYVAIGAQVVRWPAPTLDPWTDSVPVSVHVTPEEPAAGCFVADTLLQFCSL